MEYLHLFETQAAHDAVYNGDGYHEPWVGCITANATVTYNKPHDYSKDYFTIEALEDTVFNVEFVKDSIASFYITRTMRESFSYSIDNGETWVTFETPNDTFDGIAITTPLIKSGEKVLWKGIGLQNYLSGPKGAYCHFTSTGDFNVCGNIMSLAYGDDFVEIENLINTTDIFSYFFKDCQYLISAERMILPAITLANKCYSHMFQGCTSLTTAPELPVTTLAQYCYDSMFQGCASLTTAPELPATTLAVSCYNYMFSDCTSLTTAPELPTTTLYDNCYTGMFSDCTSLTTAPELPATTLANSCYAYMFQGCTSLTTAPELPATTLVQSCYGSMFFNCTSLNYIKAMFTTKPSNTYTFRWLSNVNLTGTFVKNSAATWDVTSTDGIPTGWTVETASA